MQILSIFLKLQAVKQSCSGFLAYPVQQTDFPRHWALATFTTITTSYLHITVKLLGVRMSRMTTLSLINVTPVNME